MERPNVLGRKTDQSTASILEQIAVPSLLVHARVDNDWNLPVADYMR
jgi:hypothetical protein